MHSVMQGAVTVNLNHLSNIHSEQTTAAYSKPSIILNSWKEVWRGDYQQGFDRLECKRVNSVANRN